MIELNIKQALSGMMDSVNLINELLKSGDKSDETMHALDRNYRHLEIMMEKKEVAECGQDFAAHNQAIKEGRSFTGMPEGEIELPVKGIQ